MFKLDFTSEWQGISSVDMHTGGEPLRIITSGLPVIEGNSIPDKIEYFKRNFDFLRTRIIHEPRGHADMYGAIITEAVNTGSDFGVFFLHNEGYSSMCGHAILAITKLKALSDGVLESGSYSYQIDVPSGTVKSMATFENNKIQEVSFINVPSFVYRPAASVITTEWGELSFDLVFGGAFYAYVDADQIGLAINVENSSKLIEAGRWLKKRIIEKYTIEHPYDPSLSFLYGVIFYGKSNRAGFESINACVFADGELDRSATGTGVSGKAALLHFKSKLGLNELISIESIIGSEMNVRIIEKCEFGSYDAIIPEVYGQAFVTGTHNFLFDENDPLLNGFLLR